MTSNTKKTASKKTSAGTELERDASLREELASIIKDLSGEELEFLRSQAEVMIRNREIDAYNATIEAEAAEYATTRPGKKGVKGKKTSSSPYPAVLGDPIHIVRSASGNANLVLGGDFKLLTPEELAAIAKIAISVDSEPERRARLYRWLDRERRDILIDGGMGSEGSPRMRELLSYLESAFSKRKKMG
jgi:hypothetical protein